MTHSENTPIDPTLDTVRQPLPAPCADHVTVTVIGGPYRSATWTGPLRDVPVTMIIPEGIMSARTVAEAETMRLSIREMLTKHDSIEVVAVKWAIRVAKVKTVGT